jgi:hypothetical protein
MNADLQLTYECGLLGARCRWGFLRKFVTSHKSSAITQKHRDVISTAVKPLNLIYDLLVIGGFVVFTEVTMPIFTLTCNKEKTNINMQKYAVKCSRS